jgi:hypothetical protein
MLLNEFLLFDVWKNALEQQTARVTSVDLKLYSMLLYLYKRNNFEFSLQVKNTVKNGSRHSRAQLGCH